VEGMRMGEIKRNANIPFIYIEGEQMDRWMV
jgi:hypothetical protein